jgi:hypothetical protein
MTIEGVGGDEETGKKRVRLASVSRVVRAERARA